jgi:hypothetical protein
MIVMGQLQNKISPVVSLKGFGAKTKELAVIRQS